MTIEIRLEIAEVPIPEEHEAAFWNAWRAALGPSREAGPDSQAVEIDETIDLEADDEE